MIVFFSPSGPFKDGEVKSETSSRLVMSHQGFLAFAATVAAHAEEIKARAKRLQEAAEAQRVAEKVAAERRRVDESEGEAAPPNLPFTPLH
ncbi:hypothetical protein DDF67_15025 [Caulobacter endophyticus]|uniref:Uncharacterized protein n=2 Tax=Caulobacter endophyticus TaxID=2172652 RepID=A0A2T9JTS6_9CAUL|nr:hypothetical protein DDF67_15025 [Caulobacter endophyticus]